MSTDTYQLQPAPDSFIADQQKLIIASVVGTRPEAIKMAPVCRALARCPDIHHVLISTGQHRSQLDQVFAYFDLTPDVDMDLMGKSRNLNEPSAQVLLGMDTLLQQFAPPPPSGARRYHYGLHR